MEFKTDWSFSEKFEGIKVILRCRGCTYKTKVCAYEVKGINVILQTWGVLRGKGGANSNWVL